MTSLSIEQIASGVSAPLAQIREPKIYQIHRVAVLGARTMGARHLYQFDFGQNSCAESVPWHPATIAAVMASKPARENVFIAIPPPHRESVFQSRIKVRYRPGHFRKRHASNWLGSAARHLRPAADR